MFFFFFNDTATTEIYTLSLHDALPIYSRAVARKQGKSTPGRRRKSVSREPQLAHQAAQPRYRGRAHLGAVAQADIQRSEEHTSELQSRLHLVCRLLLEKKKKKTNSVIIVATSTNQHAPESVTPCDPENQLTLAHVNITTGHTDARWMQNATAPLPYAQI